MTKGQGDLARVNSIEPDDSWPKVVQIRLGWQRGAALVFSTLDISADQFFGRAGYGAPIQGDWLVQQIDRMRKAGAPRKAVQSR
jgi:hypothetical protein